MNLKILLKKSECSFKGEKHMIGRNKNGKFKKMNFCGPGTNLDKRSKGKCSKPISKVDAQCKTHDYAYQKISNGKFKKLPKKMKKKLVRKADKDMINAMKNNKSIEAKILKKIMESKIRLEKLGLLSQLKFIS